MVRQKNMALPSPKRVRDGRKLKLQALAIALVVASRLKGDYEIADDCLGPVVVGTCLRCTALGDNTEGVGWV